MAQEVKAVALEWEGGLRFRGGLAGVPPLLIDGDNAAAPGPMATLLVALASCTGADIVHILEKMRLEIAGFRMQVRGTRREEEPRRYVAVHLTFELTGPELDDAKVARAVALSLDKYCSVAHSIAPDIAVTHDIVIRRDG